MKMMIKRFTLIEFFVVMAVMLLLVSVLQPSLKKAIEFSRQLSCGQNYKNINLAMSFYLSDDGFYPIANSNVDGSNEGNISWDDGLGFGYDGRNLTIAEANKRNFYNPESVQVEQNIYECPNDWREGNWLRSYALNCNQSGYNRGGFSNFRDRGVRFSVKATDVPDPSGTLLLAETNWGKLSAKYLAGVKRPWAFAIQLAPHQEEHNYLFADGHVEKLSMEETYNPDFNNNVVGKSWTRSPND